MGRLILATGQRFDVVRSDGCIRQFLDHVHLEDRHLVEGLFDAVRSGEAFPEIEYRLQIDSDTYRWIVERSLPRGTGREAPNQYVSVAFDVTERKEARRRLRESEKRFKDIAEVAGDWFWEMDVERRFTYLSDRFYALFDLNPDDIIGKTRAEFANASSDDAEWRQHRNDLANDRPLHAYRYSVCLPSGTKHLEINGKPTFDETGAFQGYRGTGTDRTAEIEGREALVRSERQFRDLVEGSIQGICIHNDGEILFANEALADMFGYENSDMLLALDGIGPLLHPDERKRLWDYKIAREKGEHAPEFYEVRCIKEDGSLIWAEFRIKRVEWRGVAAKQCAVVDITDRKNAEEALVRQNRELRDQNSRFNVALANMSQGLCMFDAEQRLVVSNDRYAQMYALPPEIMKQGITLREILEHRIKNDIYAGSSPEDYIEERIAWVTSGVRAAKAQHLKDGRVVSISHQPMADGGWLTTHEDITEFHRLGERLDDALNTMCQGLCMFDDEKRLVVCNKRYLEMYDLPPDLSEPGTLFREIIEHRIRSGVYAGSDPDVYVQERLAAVEERESSTKIQKLTNDRVISIVHQPMANGGWLATHEDITELQRVHEQIAHMAHHDALTDLPNRTLLRERIAQVLPQAKRDKNFAILCLDLDRFKSVNDTLGHSVGDTLLQGVAERLRGCVRESDTIARLGGDEFAIVQVSDNQPADATALAKRICVAIREPFDLVGNQIVIGASVGIAIAPGDGLDADTLVKNADMALYRAKSDGRGVFRFFEAEMDARVQARRLLELDLRQGLEQSEFELHYQPLVNLESNSLCGVEALLRWNHPKRGVVPPDEFIPLAEEIGLIIPIGEWVIRTACMQAARWPADVKIAVNLSPAQFRSDRLVPTVFSALAKSGIAPGRLELEITEAVLLADNQTTLDILHQLRDMGVRIAMDDFGTGYSSLSYLRSFPFDKIKIDGSFVSDLANQDGAAAIVEAVANLSRSLGMTTTAECVETEEQLEQVRAAGYTEMQGYLFSPPRRAADITEIYFSSTARSKVNA